MAGGPVTGNRGRAGKFNKPSRGGGKKFSRSLQPVDADGNQISMWADTKDERSEEEDEDSEEESDEDSSEDGGPSKPAAEAENRDDRKALKKARKEAAIAKQKSRTVEVGDLPSSDGEESDDGMPANPNHSKAARKQAKGNEDVDEIAEGVQNMDAPGNRKEREALAAAAAKEKYNKLQAEGKTDQAKADLARLKLIREQRAADAARRQAEKEERDEQEKIRKAEIEAKEAKKREAAAGPKKSSKKK
ncbi:hypothetical protein QQS21_001834 [Conoideocrella luteorostrata]|uniref:Casein kinase substrate phosphoprotein PP28 domain-containing protein n=1 Tax=Conoideocrella luteorostrata TaxID=1105319 RepID=A0AAJ0G1R0_9HYPO|nr:hypothetical protein QQS21_001834 [Conoideocrella luteorostrata]